MHNPIRIWGIKMTRNTKIYWYNLMINRHPKINPKIRNKHILMNRSKYQKQKSKINCHIWSIWKVNNNIHRNPIYQIKITWHINNIVQFFQEKNNPKIWWIAPFFKIKVWFKIRLIQNRIWKYKLIVQMK